MTDHRPEPGFRLQCLEVLNWGTFNQRVWTFDVKGQNALVTGEIGSGKSTLVDAITTLLVPSNRITYNKAAGAESRERNLRSYVLGYFKSERSEESGSKPVALREERSTCSVILARFSDAVLGETVTLAQVFWFRDVNQPEKLYVVADEALSIKQDFSGFGTEISGLRKRLKQRPICEMFSSFTEYAASFRRRLGIDSNQALELFHQTVSMKAVGNLTDFVRTHMLEAPDVDERIENLLAHFADLDRAHEAVIQAQQQIDQLTPLLGQCARFEELQAKQKDLDGCHHALRSWMADRRLILIDGHVLQLDGEIRHARAEADEATGIAERLTADTKNLIIAIGQNGGDRLEQIDASLKHARQELQRCQVAMARFLEHCTASGLPVPGDGVAFNDLRFTAQQKRTELQPMLREADNLYMEAGIQIRTLAVEERRLTNEIISLRTRRSNLPSQHIVWRQQLLKELGDASEEDLPYAGELIRLRPGDEAWQGGIERVLRGLGLAMLVPTSRYRAVAVWVERTRMQGRFVYYHADDLRSRHPFLHRRSLVQKVEVQAKAWAREWLVERLHQNFDYACCETIEEFEQETFALTINGQIKSRDRHEKDDRFAVDDRTRYILGWSNEDKIKALEAQLADVNAQGQKHLAAQMDSDGQRKHFAIQDQALGRLLECERWSDLDAAPHRVLISRLTEEVEELKRSSTILADLNARLEKTEAERSRNEARLAELHAHLVRADTNRKQALDRRRQFEAARDEMVPGDRDIWFVRLALLLAEHPEERVLTWDGNDPLESTWQHRIRHWIVAITKESDGLRDGIVKGMEAFRQSWPILTQELDARMEAASGFGDLLRRLTDDDLPRFTADFRRALKENTINEIASFQTMLENEQRQIRERIAEINRSLREIDYHPGQYIELVEAKDPDAEIADFRFQLRACTENALGDHEEGYSEIKFQQVRVIIERFKGRDGLTEADRRWRDKVADVRNWAVYGASVRHRSDGKESEHYSDSGGKSGGQKEKLAYTVLAASIAYRYGLRDHSRRRAFRFVVIDEAFGRGSDTSAQFGLELFEKLGLQLLIATPLQKIRVIDPFVANFGFVSNNGRESTIHTLTIEEYRAKIGLGGG
jgi:uncharacterized protein YPO0396